MAILAGRKPMNPTDGPTGLFELDGNPLPEGIACGFLSTPDRVRLRFAVAPSRLDSTRGTVVLLQGRNETIEKYFETIADLTALGYAVATFDWRGQGGSQRLRGAARTGHVPSFDAYAIDLETIFRSLILPDCTGPYAILAHSMGGAVALLAAPRIGAHVARIVAAAPLIGMPGNSRANGLFLGMNTMRFLGLGRVPVRGVGRSAGWTAERNPLTSDTRRFERNRALMKAAPQLFVGGPTAAWVAGAVGAARRLDDSDVIAALRVPTLIVTAGHDRVVSSPAAERLAWRMRSGHALSVPGARHELMQEADLYRAPFIAAFDSFAGAALPL
ncbi:MAG: alpha/beta hydrolase [Hyphomicrobiales bacterium]|nr:MAG: alpha/beta hydrolase [Hyphomicrobiales bacterium]